MRWNIVIPYRPLTEGNRNNPLCKISQLSDGRWDSEIKYYNWLKPEFENDELHRAIYYINKNSVFKHNIIVAIDSDIYPNDTWLKEYDNVKWIKSEWVVPPEMWAAPDKSCISLSRMAAADEAGIFSVADDEWVVYAFIEDAIPCKQWDMPIVDAIMKYDDEYIYVPNFVECHSGIHSLGGTLIHGQETPELIWDTWRKNQCCNALVMPTREGRTWINEQDFDDYIKVANSERPDYFVELAGVRQNVYYAFFVMKAGLAKRVGFHKQHCFDLLFDAELGQLGVMKMGITDSYVLHPYYEFRWERPKNA